MTPLPWIHRACGRRLEKTHRLGEYRCPGEGCLRIWTDVQIAGADDIGTIDLARLSTVTLGERFEELARAVRDLRKEIVGAARHDLAEVARWLRSKIGRRP